MAKIVMLATTVDYITKNGPGYKELATFLSTTPAEICVTKSGIKYVRFKIEEIDE